MQEIIEKYFLEDSSSLVYSEEGPNGVNCWFDAGKLRQHRCLTFEDFETIRPL